MLFVWSQPLDLSDMGIPAQHSSQGHRDMQAPQPRQGCTPQAYFRAKWRLLFIYSNYRVHLPPPWSLFQKIQFPSEDV